MEEDLRTRGTSEAFEGGAYSRSGSGGGALDVGLRDPEVEGQQPLSKLDREEFLPRVQQFVSIPYTERDIDSESSSTSTDTSDSEEFGNESGSAGDVRAGRPRARPAWTSRAIHATRDARYDDEVFGEDQSSSIKLLSHAKTRRKSRQRKSNSFKTKAHLHKMRPRFQNSEIPNVEQSEATTYSDGGTTYSEDKRTCFDENDVDNSLKIPTENDETLPADFLSEFLTVAQTIDEFYESVHMKKFLENRILATSRDRVDVTTSSSGLEDMTSNESVVDRTASTETFSAELRKRIRSLERLCSFVEYSDEERSETAGSLADDVRELQDTTKEEQPVWRLSQQSINLTLSRRNRSNTSSEATSGRSRCTSQSGSGSSNSRCSTRQGNYKATKSDVTSVENIRSPDSGFSEHVDSPSGIKSPDACQLGTAWAGSMQWDYSDWEFYYGVGCPDGQIGVPKDHEGLITIDEITARPQDPLDWDWQ